MGSTAASTTAYSTGRRISRRRRRSFSQLLAVTFGSSIDDAAIELANQHWRDMSLNLGAAHPPPSTTSTSLPSTFPPPPAMSSPPNSYMNQVEHPNHVDHAATSAAVTTDFNVGQGIVSTTTVIPQQDKNGVYQLHNEEEYMTLLRSNPDKLVVIKFYATYCPACKQLAPKLLRVIQDEQLSNLPIVWGEFQSTKHTKELFRQLRVLSLPTIHFYDGSLQQTLANIQNNNNNGLVENFPCPPSKITVLKKKLSRFINSRVDPNTLQLKPIEELSDETNAVATGGDDNNMPSSSSSTLQADNIITHTTVEQQQQQPSQEQFELLPQPRRQRDVNIVDNEFITQEHIDYLRYGMPFFKDCTDEEFSTMLSKAKLLTFDRGDIIIKQGMPGTTFYVIKSGSVEMFIRHRFDDIISTPYSQYLGVQVNTLHAKDYIGERSLTTGEPIAASFKVLEKARCFAFHVDTIPPSSILSKQRRASQEFVEHLNQRYILPENVNFPVSREKYSSSAATSFVQDQDDEDDCVLELLVRLKQIRQAARCFDYIMNESPPRWGDVGEIVRREILVKKLSSYQRNEFNEIFNMVDVKNEGHINLLAIKRFMQSAKPGNKRYKTDQELVSLIDQRTSRRNLNTVVDTAEVASSISISREEFLGVMAEAEFYNLLKDTFQELDFDKTGYVKAGDLDEVLGGVRDLISPAANFELDENSPVRKTIPILQQPQYHKTTSLIDVDDQNILVDYEQFTKMLLGAAL